MTASDFLIEKLDRLIPPSVAVEEEQKLRARVILSVMLLCSSSVGMVSCILLLVTLFGSQPIWDGVLSALIVSLVWYGGIVYFRRSANLSGTCHVFAFIMYSSTLGALLTTGGWSSPVTPLMLAVPAGIFLVAGRRVGLTWSVIAGLSYYVLWVLHQKNINLIQIVRDEHRDNLVAGIWCFSAFIMISCMAVYDRMAEILKESLRAEREQYRHRVTTDFISGALNRFGIQKQFEELRDQGENILLLYFNIANLSMINSELHYQAGDELIAQVAKAPGQVFGTAAVVGRITGGEFLVLLPGVPDRERAEDFAGKLHQAFGHPFRVIEGQHELSVRGGIGAALSLQPHRDFRQLLRIAHEAMQESDDQQSAFVMR